MAFDNIVVVLKLTPRQLQTLECLRDGLTDKEIAARFGISYRTATGHVSVVLLKLTAKTRAQAVAQGMRRRLIA